MSKRCFLLTVVIVGFVLLLVALFLLMYYLENKNNLWFCFGGEWQKQGYSGWSKKPQVPCGDAIADEDQGIIINEPKEKEIVSSPLKIAGSAMGNWFFEASFPILIIDEEGREMGRGVAQAMDNWMTEEFVAFEAEINFVCTDENQNGFLIFKKSNPSGLLENDQEKKMEVSWKCEKMEIKIYWGNKNKNEEQDECQAVYPVTRNINRTQAVLGAVMDNLLIGPNEQEIEDGYFTSINEGVKINNLTVVDGVAKIDFDGRIEEAVGGSCRVSAIRSQIINTAKQFDTVKDVVISVDGRTEDILQP